MEISDFVLILPSSCLSCKWTTFEGFPYWNCFQSLIPLLYIIIIIIIIIIMEFLTSQLWLGNIHQFWDVVINRIFKKFLTIEHVLRITDFCSCIYVLGCKLNLVRLCRSDFGITPVHNITIGITCAAFCYLIAHMSFTSSWYLVCLSIIVLAILCVLGADMSIEKVFFVFLFVKLCQVD